MATKPRKPEDLAAVAAAFNKAGTISGAARLLRRKIRTVQDQVDDARDKGFLPPRPPVLEPSRYPGRKILDLYNGTAIAASDAHYWPGPPSTAHRALVFFIPRLKPQILVKNGDVLDMGKVSRHPPLGWTRIPEVKDEIEVAQDRLAEIESVTPKGCKKLWPCGNHDARFEVKIATVAPELGGVPGTSLQDHFPNWEPCWSLFVNDRPGGLVIKHRFKGGVHAAHNNTLWAGRSLCSGHLHSQKVSPVTDYNGTRYGVDTGCLADPWGEQFSYLEDNPRNWISGFAVFTFREGVLMPPELVTVVGDGMVAFRGELYEV